ncbi:MAG: hypothetical protein HUJ25_03575 [Crocinitomicaceae bacterium]|nr:hypothetical protein [Crocinitomicaceae bacterium]
MMLNQVYNFDGGTVSPLNHTIVHISFDNNDRIDEKMVLDAYKKKLELVGSNRHASIIDFNKKLSTFSDEALRKVLTNMDPFDKNFVTVLCVSSFFARLELMLYLRTHYISDNIILAKNLNEAKAIIYKQEKVRKEELSAVG